MKTLCSFLFVISIIISSNAQPIISTFSPSSGPVGATVIIHGSNFNTTISNNVVYFGSVKANVISANSDSLVVLVPYGSSSHFIFVTNLGTNLSAYSNRPFILTFPCFEGISSSSFSSGFNFQTNFGPLYVTAGDIDEDGLPDMVIVSGASGISVLRNISAGGSISFAPQEFYSTGPSSNPWGIAIGDLDNDGKSDIAVSNSLFGGVSIFHNNSTIGSILFDTIQTFSSDPVNHIAISDFDGDGKPDLAIVLGFTNRLLVLRNTSVPGSISFITTVDLATETDPIYVAVGDLNDDSKTDIVIANNDSNTISIFMNTSDSGLISFASKIDFITGHNPRCIDINDIDGDGKMDLAVTSITDKIVSVFQNNSSAGNISFAPRIDYLFSGPPYHVQIDDLDGDGKPDMLVSVTSSNVFSMHKNTSSSGSISFSPAVTFPTASNPSNAFTGDINNDGKPDIIIGNWSTYGIDAYENIQCTVGLNETIGNPYKIFPNPAEDQIEISIPEKSEIKICNMEGQIISEFSLCEKNTSIDISTYSPGMYLMYLNNGKEITIKKFIKE